MGGKKTKEGEEAGGKMERVDEQEEEEEEEEDGQLPSTQKSLGGLSIQSVKSSDLQEIKDNGPYHSCCGGYMTGAQCDCFSLWSQLSGEPPRHCERCGRPAPAHCVCHRFAT